jgi:hypothetical protein
METRSKLIGWAKLALGVGFTLEGILALKGKPADSLLGGVPRRRMLAGDVEDDTPGFKKSRITSVRSIEERIDHIRKLTKKSSLDPKVKEKVFGVLTKRCNGGKEWCLAEKDYLAEIRALFKAVRDPSSPLAIRYTRDHVDVDQYASARRTFELHAGDCDCYSIALGAALMACGYPVRFRVIQTKGASSWSHIYLLVGVPPTNPTKWIPLDASVNKPAGWEAPGAADVARTGRPAGMVVKVKDFAV